MCASTVCCFYVFKFFFIYILLYTETFQSGSGSVGGQLRSVASCGSFWRNVPESEARNVGMTFDLCHNYRSLSLHLSIYGGEAVSKLFTMAEYSFILEAFVISCVNILFRANINPVLYKYRRRLEKETLFFRITDRADSSFSSSFFFFFLLLLLLLL